MRLSTSIASRLLRLGGPRTAAVRAACALLLAVTLLPLGVGRANAAASLTITPITWNVVGLDSNNVTVGPNEFLSGAKVCNTGSSAATNVVATYVWDSANANIQLQPGSGSTRSKASLAAAACYNAMFNVEITRTAAAYNTTRGFHITATGDALGTVITPTPRELYVEKLVSQNRNGVLSITGPTTVYVGNTYTYTVTSKTATGGYEQLSSFLDWPGAIFDVQTVSAAYAVPAGATNSTVYADACGWDNAPASANYRSCIGPNGYAGGKAGGNPIVTTYTVEVIAAGTTTLGETIYDFSGSSYHYNSDFGTGLASYSITAVAPAQSDLAVTKIDTPDPVIAGNDVTYTLNVTNNGPDASTTTTLTDPLPAGTSFVSATDGGTLSAGTVTWNLGALASGASTSVDLVLTVDPSMATNLSNTATVTTSSIDPTSGNDSATEATTVDTSADLSIVKSDSPDPVGVGEPLAYSLAVANAGPSDARNVHVGDVLPAGVTFGSATSTQGTCSEAAGTVTCDLGTVPAGGSATVTIEVTPSLANVGSISNTATVSSTTSDPLAGNDSSTEGTTVVASADVSITKADSADPIVAGNSVTYQMVVTNDGPSPAQNVQVTDPLPAGTTFVSATGGGVESGGTVAWDLGTMASGASASLEVVVTVDADTASDLTNTATVASTTSDPNPANDSATEATTVQTSADVGVTISDAPDPVTAGTDLVYTIGVTNAGPSDATGVVLSDPLPAGTSFVSASGGGTESGGTVTWNLGTIPAGGSATLTLTVHVDPARTADLSDDPTVTTTTTDPNAANDSANETTALETSADLAITKTDGSANIAAGVSATYTITVTNDGPSTVPAGIVVTDPVPADTTASTAEPDCAIALGVLTCTSSSALAPGDSVAWQVTLQVSGTYAGASLSNTAAILSSPVIDPNAANDSATDTDAVAEIADLSIVKTDLADPVTAGTDLTYELVVTNAGPSDATDVHIGDPLPAGTSFVSATAGGTESGGTITWDLGSVPNGATTTVRVTVHVDAAQAADLSNTANVSGSTFDPTPANDLATEATTVQTSADLSIAKTATAATVGAGSSVAYTIVVTNAGPSDAQQVVVTDPLPAGTTFVSATGGGVESGGVVTWNLGTVAAGSFESFQVTLHVDNGAPIGALVNTASAGAATPDPDGVDPTSSALVNVVPAGGTATDLGITKVVDDAEPAPGQVVTYTITVSNHGPVTATHVEIRDRLPAGLTYVDSDASQGSYHPSTHVWRVGRIAVGDWARLRMTARVDEGATGTIVNTASTSHLAQTDTNPANDASARGVTVRRVANGGALPGGSIAHTGADLARAAAILNVLIGLGIAAVLAARRRDRRTGSQRPA